MIGVDVAQIARFEKHVNNRRFHDRILTEHEQALFAGRPNAENLAAFFAVKEACAKAYGTGIGRIGWRDIELRHTPLGQPHAALHDRKNGRIQALFVSITHDAGIVVATAQLGTGRAVYQTPLARELKGLLLDRPRDMHKGKAGRACLVGGKPGMTGSVSLAAQAALRSGAGYVYAAVRPEAAAVVQQKLTEPIVLPVIGEDPGALLESVRKMDAAGVGPGLGTDAIAKTLLTAFLEEDGCPLVLDADALTLLAENPELLQTCKRALILTPHKGEMDRLCPSDSELTPDAFALKYGIILIEKGPATRIHADRTYTNTSGNAGLATSGTGDVLTGVITGLLARGYAPVEAARLGVWVHGTAGDLVRDEIGEEGMIASDLLPKIAVALYALQEENDGFWEHLGRD